MLSVEKKAKKNYYKLFSSGPDFLSTAKKYAFSSFVNDFPQ